MSQTKYPLSPQIYRSHYDRFVDIASGWSDISLEEIVEIHPLGKKFVNDGKALEPKNNRQSYKQLESELTSFLREYKSAEAYSSAAANDIGNRFASVLAYIDMLQTRFDTDPVRVERLVVEMIKTLMGKIKYDVWQFVPQKYLRLYDQAEAEFRQ